MTENWDLHGAPEGPPSAVLVELFTCGGCGSCRSATEVLAQLNLMREEGTPIFTLGFEVDSNPAFAERQASYALSMQIDEAATPQMVVSGETAFDGTDARRAGAAISAALDTPSTPIALAVVGDTAGIGSTGSIEVRIAVQGGLPEGSDLVVALVERSTSLVRSLVVADHESATTAIPLPHGLPSEQLHVVAFVQDRETLHVSGATSTATSGR